jgi:hypothetical protein
MTPFRFVHLFVCLFVYLFFVFLFGWWGVCSQVMTIICLAMDIDDLKERLGRIIVGETCGHVRCAMSNAQCAPDNVHFATRSTQHAPRNMLCATFFAPHAMHLRIPSHCVAIRQCRASMVALQLCAAPSAIRGCTCLL